MTKLLDDAIRSVYALPPVKQDEIARAMMRFADTGHAADEPCRHHCLFASEREIEQVMADFAEKPAS